MATEGTLRGKSQEQSSIASLTQEKVTKSNAIEVPQISLPKGGGALKRMDEKFEVNPASGTTSFSIPLRITPGRRPVNCSFSIQKSTIQSSPIGDQYPRHTENEYSSFLDFFGTIESIITSSAQNDRGMFEVDLCDEHFLPSENAGAESTWRIELSSEIRQSNYHKIGDVILHIRYTARQGGAQLTEKASSNLKEFITNADDNGLARMFTPKQDFPNEWHRFTTSEGVNFQAVISKDHFPYIAQSGKIEKAGKSCELWVMDREDLQRKFIVLGTMGDEANPKLIFDFDKLEEGKTSLSIPKSKLKDSKAKTDIFHIVKYRLTIKNFYVCDFCNGNCHQSS